MSHQQARSSRRIQFEKQLREKYKLDATAQDDGSKKVTHIVDEDALLLEHIQQDKTAPLLYEKSSHRWDNHDEEEEEDDNDDAVFIKQAVAQELARQQSSPPPRHANDSTLRKEEEKKKKTQFTKRRHKEDFSSDDEVRRPTKLAQKLEASSSRGAPDQSAEATVYRDKSGRRISQREWAEERDARKRPRAKSDQKPQVQKIAEKDLAWGGGLVQKKLEEERKKYEAEVAQEPFTRYEITESYDKEMKDKLLWEDPLKNMLQGDSSSNAAEGHSKTASPDDDDDSKLRRKRFAAPPNRYQIPPGSHWDGKVRGTNFEEKYLDVVGSKHHALRLEKNQYSFVAD